MRIMVTINGRKAIKLLFVCSNAWLKILDSEIEGVEFIMTQLKKQNSGIIEVKCCL